MQKNAKMTRLFPRLIAVLVLLTMIIGTIPVSADDSISDWVPYSEAPSGAEIVARKWVYNLTENTESESSSLSGWTANGSYWKETGRGSVNYASFPQYYDTSNSIYTSFNKSALSAYDNGSTKREVSNAWAGFVYWHWMYNVSYANNIYRTISDRAGDFDQYGKTPGFVYKYFSAFTSSVDCPYLDNYYCCSRNQASYNCVDVMPDKSSLGTGTPRYFRFDYYKSSYVDYKKIYKYTKVTRKESTTEVTAGNGISNVVMYVRYRKSNVAVTGIALNKANVTIVKGQTDTLTTTIYPSNATNKTVTWTTSNSSVCTVDSGKVYAVGAGTATIVAKTNNGYTASCTYQVIDNSVVEVTSVSLDRTSLALTVGGTATLTATVLPSNASNKTVTWTSSSTSVATVSGGKVTAVGEGTATITVKTSNNKTATCSVTVSKPVIEVTGVSLDKTSLALTEGGTATLTATVLPSNASDKSVSWTSGNTSVATVSGGKVTAVGEGTTTITVKTSNNKTATCTVNVSKKNIEVTSVSLDKTSLALIEGGTATLTATVLPSNASDKSVTWTSSNTSVALVSNGEVIAVEEGTATITVKTSNNKTATCTVTVSKENIDVTSVSLNKTSLALTEGGTATLTATVTPSNATNKAVTWTSSNTSIAKVSGGKITAVGEGTATITAKTSNGKTATCSVTVSKATVAVTGVTLNKSTLSLTIGSNATLTATVAPSNATNKTLTWTSSNTSVATVTSSGKVTGVAAGTATVTVKSNNGKTATCTVTVNSVAVTSVILDKASLTLTAGKSETLTATISPSNATNKTLTWTSSNTSVATVTSSGKVTGVNPGTATITVKSSNGKSSSCSISVAQDPSKGFTWGQDNWRFNNSFGQKGEIYKDHINNEYLNKLKDNLTNKEYEAIFTGYWYYGKWYNAWLNDEWGGSCYGMSSLAFLSKNGLFPYSSYNSSAKKLYDLSLNDGNVKSLITYYQMIQVKDVIQQEYRTRPKIDDKDSIKEIISLLKTNPVVLIGIKNGSWGHAILAYGYEYGSWTKNGVTYQGRILICDPNSSSSYNEENHIYFDTTEYYWAIPRYSYVPIISSLGACFNYVGCSVTDINQGGYLSGNNKTNNQSFVARIDAYEISNNRSISKVEETNGVYSNKSSGPNDIVEDYSTIASGDNSKGVIGYNLYDSNSSYKVAQNSPVEMVLKMDYENCDLFAGTVAGKSVIFDNNGLVSIDTQYAEYSLGMVFEKNYPTNWFAVFVSGNNADDVSLKKTNEGYVISSDNLGGVLVKVNNKEEMLSRTLMTDYPSALIYQKASGGIGFKVDTDNNGTYETALNADDMPTISKQPANCTCNENEAAVFSVTAKGTGLTYLWQYMNAGDTNWTSWTSKTTASISVAYSAARNGMKVRCVITDADGKQVISNTAKLNYNIAIAITTQPSSVTVDEGKSADFTVVAKGKGLKYLWQYKEAGKSSWTDWTSKTTASISVAFADYRDGMSLRCVVTDASGKKVTSNVATLTYNYPLSITKQPASVTVTANSAASFSVTATGKGLKYLWQYKEAGKSSWTDWTSKTTASISVAFADYRDGMSLRCVVTDASGKKATSNAATLTYNYPLSITKQPASVTVTANSAASFSVTATGKGLKYLWQYKEAGKSSWTDWTSKTTASISVAFADYRDGMSLRCVVTDASGKKATSNTATLTYNYPLSITKQPASITVSANSAASFSVTATGKGLKYLWQYKEAGKSSWTDWTSKTTASISVAFADYRDGMSVRCIVTDASGKKVTSNAATLTYNYPLAITKQPSSTTAAKNSSASFSVTATGNGLKYQWQYKNAGDSSWTDWTSKTTASISVAYADYRNGMSVRCIVTDSTGKKVTSNTATLSYK